MALKSTLAINIAPDPATIDAASESKTTLPERFKAYADAPDGLTKNKYIVYQTHDVDHSINLLMRMVEKGWKIRAAFHEFADKRTIRIEKQAYQAGLINANK